MNSLYNNSGNSSLINERILSPIKSTRDLDLEFRLAEAESLEDQIMELSLFFDELYEENVPYGTFMEWCNG